MKLLEILTIDCIKAPLEAVEKEDVINELIDTLSQAGRVRDPADLKQAVWAREQTRTTGIGHGLAIPHGKSSGVDEMGVAIGKPKEPLDFASIDNKPVRLIVLLASPPDRTSDHIQALADVTRLLNAEAFRERLYEARTPEQIMELLQTQSQEV